MPITAVHLSGGPGDFGEGFAGYDDKSHYKTLISAEHDAASHTTLRLRSFYHLIRGDPRSSAGYYDFCNGVADTPFNGSSESAWNEAGVEARRLTIGDPADNILLGAILDTGLRNCDRWVLTGRLRGPLYIPLRRNADTVNRTLLSSAEERHYIFNEVLRIIRERRPPVYVLEIPVALTSVRLGNRAQFDLMLNDLSDPDAAFESPRRHTGYTVHSLAKDAFFRAGMEPGQHSRDDFVVRPQEFGIPECRRRVLLLGIRADIQHAFPRLQKQSPLMSTRDAICDLPPIRAELAGGAPWLETVEDHLSDLARKAAENGRADTLVRTFLRARANLNPNLAPGALRLPRNPFNASAPYDPKWYLDPNLDVWLNHESPKLTSENLRRTIFAAVYATCGTGADFEKDFKSFGLRGTDPDGWPVSAQHFHVQSYDSPARLSARIAKDLRCFIHPDATQARPFTVREAARLQTFPDNFFFQGNRTAQYRQVGSAFPPKLSRIVADAVMAILS